MNLPKGRVPELVAGYGYTMVEYEEFVSGKPLPFTDLRDECEQDRSENGFKQAQDLARGLDELHVLRKKNTKMKTPEINLLVTGILAVMGIAIGIGQYGRLETWARHQALEAVQ